ncbi:MAG: hypothetical protein ACTSRP_08955 [Candidatus Helarchaeota archaeon]
MSSTIELNLPMIDEECIMKAIESLKLSARKQDNSILILEKNIRLTPTNYGYTVKINPINKMLIKKLQNKYDQLYAQKLRRLKEEEESLKELKNKIKSHIQSLKQLAKIKQEEKLAKIKQEIEKMELEKQKQEEKLKHLQKEREEYKNKIKQFKKDVIEIIKSRVPDQELDIKEIPEKDKIVIAISY